MPRLHPREGVKSPLSDLCALLPHISLSCVMESLPKSYCPVFKHYGLQKCSQLGLLIVETAWDLGPFAAMLARQKRLFEQQSTKKL